MDLRKDLETKPLANMSDRGDVFIGGDPGSPAERDLLDLIEASGALLASPRSEQVLGRIITLAQQFVRADAHAVWHKDIRGNWSVLSSSNLSGAYIQKAFVASGESQTALVEPLWCPDVERAAALVGRRQQYAEEGIQALLAVPLKIAGEPVGSVTYYWRSRHVCTESQIRIARALSSLAAAALNVAGAYESETQAKERAEHSERQAAFLAEAGAVLSTSLEYQATLANVARLAVPAFADWCSVDILDARGRVQRVAVQHSDPEKISFAYEFSRRFPPRDDDLSRVALRTGQSVLLRDIPDELISERARSEEHLQMIRQLGLNSVIAAPMVLNGQTFGLITFVHAESGRRYGPEDLRVAEEVSRRAAIAIAHARLYEQVCANEQRLQLAVDIAGLGIWENNLQTGFVTASEQALRIFGFQPSDGFQFKDLLARVDPGDAEELQTVLADSAPNGTFQIEYRLHHPDGALRWILAYGRHAVANSGPASVIGVAADVTDRHNMLAREREARRTAQLLNSVGPVLLSELNPDTLVQRVVDLATALTGAELGLLITHIGTQPGNAVSFAVSGEAADSVTPTLVERLKLSGLAGSGVVRCSDLIAQDASQIFPSLAAVRDKLSTRSLLLAPIAPRSGTAFGALLFMHAQPDMFTEQHEQIAIGIAAQAAIAFENARLFDHAKQNQEALRKSNEELRLVNEDLNQFAYSASHDLQEPLRMVAIYTQMLDHRYSDRLDDRARQFMTYVINGAKRMEMLVKDLLAFTKATGPLEGDIPVTSADDVLKDALFNLKTSLEECGATVTREALPCLRVNPTHLLQLFQNLIGNALKYRKANLRPAIRITSENDGSIATISVCDNGIGISPAYANQIFGIFKRLHSAEEYSGTGIGLAICHRLVGRYGGKIWVESTEGEGATFHFTLPCVQEAGGEGSI